MCGLFFFFFEEKAGLGVFACVGGWEDVIRGRSEGKTRGGGPPPNFIF